MLTETLRRVGPVEGVGISRIDFNFKIFEASDVLVIRTTDGVDTTLKLQNDYTVTFDKDQVANAGGYITLVDFLSSGETVTILSNIAYSQNLDLHSEGDFNPQDINTELDRHVAQIQQLNEKLSRAAVVPASRDKTGEEWGDELVSNSELSKEYAEQARASAVAAAAVAQEAAGFAGAAEASSSQALQASTAVKQIKVQIDNLSVPIYDNRVLAEQAAERAEAAAQLTAFSYRSVASIRANETTPASNLTPARGVKVGDTVVSLDNGAVFPIVDVSGGSVTVGAQQGSLKGPAGEQGVQGEPGPTGDKGPTGDMGQSPFATCFGQFEVKPNGMLALEYVGLQPADFSINDIGEVEVSYADT